MRHRAKRQARHKKIGAKVRRQRVMGYRYKGYGMRHSFWVNAYAVTQNYGGPEEGGWWYDSGELLSSARVPGGESKAVAVKDALQAKLNAEYGRYQDNDEKVRVYVEEHPGESFPSTSPHYE